MLSLLIGFVVEAISYKREKINIRTLFGNNIILVRVIAMLQEDEGSLQ
jgi:hypothetical protein